MLSLSLITTLEDFTTLSKRWNDLLTRTPANSTKPVAPSASRKNGQGCLRSAFCIVVPLSYCLLSLCLVVF